MSILKKFFKDTIIYGLAAVLPRVINFFLVTIHTDVLPPESYADNTDFYIWAALFSVLLTYGMETAFFRFYSQEKQKDSLVSTAFFTILATTSIFGILSYVFAPELIQLFHFQNNPVQFKILVGILILDTIAMVPFALLRASNRPVKYAFLKLTNVAIIVLINILFLKWVPQQLEGGYSVPEFLVSIFNSTQIINFIFLANLAGSAFCLLLLVPYLVKFKFKFDLKLLKKMLRYGWPILVAGIAYAINEHLDKLLIGHYINKESEGAYAAVYKLAIFMNLYIMAFRLGAEPFFFNHAKEKNAKETYAKILNYFVIIGALVFVGIVSYIDLIKYFINSNYWQALSIVPVVLLAYLFLGIYHNLAVWYKLTDKTRYGMYFSIIGAIVTIVINVVFLPIYGVIASAFATMTAYGCMMTLSYFIGKKYYPVSYNLTKIGIYLGFSILISAISFIYFRENYWVSTGLCFAFGAVIFWQEKEELKRIFNKK
ncbi:MAG: polysaccharide biosynthesis protein [Flavobacteriaceae bacterium]|nr:MAG: polysaccharide biosynthesis protein [Flavobacteriaceae bacterium]